MPPTFVIDASQSGGTIPTLPGRKFSVGIIGNRLSSRESRWSGLYDERGYHFFPVLEIASNVGAGNDLYNCDPKSHLPTEAEAQGRLCPAPIPAALERQLTRFAVAAFESIGALYLSRIDFRVGRDGRPNLMEINTLPGINPDLSLGAGFFRAAGYSYHEMAARIPELPRRHSCAGSRYSQRV